MRLLIITTLILSADTQTTSLPPGLEHFLDTGTWDTTPRAFRIIALSNLADGCAGANDLPCIESVLRHAKALPASRDGLFLTHLNLIYGAADSLGHCPDPKAHEALSRELMTRSLADPTRHAASYGASSFRWPADQSATLASLARFDSAHGTTLLERPLREWEAVMQKHLDAKTGLPWSEVTGKAPNAKTPRGCAQSYLTRYLAEADPGLAHEWWLRYREHFTERVGPMVGFREWPRGVNRKADIDSGPIVFGIGAAASAFGVAAAKVQGDDVLAAQLEASQTTALSTGMGGDAARSVLAQSIAFAGRKARVMHDASP